MKLVAVTVENFQSITAARKIPLSQLTTLVGPNNEGKSNILRAIVIAVKYLVGRRTLNYSRPIYARPSRLRRRELTRYDWDNDCPLNLQKKGTEEGSKITWNSNYQIRMSIISTNKLEAESMGFCPFHWLLQNQR